MSKKDRIEFKILDDLSGISHYEGKIDNRWVLFEYDPKEDYLVYYFDKQRLPRGTHKLDLVIGDDRGKYTNFSKKFITKPLSYRQY